GRFYNGGHVTYVDMDTPISDYTDDLFVSFENISDLLNRVGDRENLRDLILDASKGNAAYDRLIKWGFDLGKEIYTTATGNPVGLDYDNDDTGEINIDNEYDTTTVLRLDECTETQLQLIYESNNYVSNDVKEYCRVALGIELEDAD
ncbi:MAG TPA: hypothetical protein VK666_20215, partial [Chryseolinea sp.]|nr:hypothetical protein [Chryseolinea sp.]